MPNSSDLLADLPAPRDDEPASLRQDILDELSDHLSCALHRELVKAGDPQVAEARVLARFGDPRRLAVQLWFQAMWSRIMLQRVSMGLQGLLTVGVLATAFLLFRVLDFQSRLYDDWQAIKNQSASNQAMLVQLVQRLPQPAGVSEGGSGFGMMTGMGGEAAGGMSGMAAGGMPGMGAEGMGMGGAPSTPPNLIIQVADPANESQPAKDYFLEVQDENGQGLPGEAVGVGYGEMGMGGFAPMAVPPSNLPGGAAFSGGGLPSGVTFTGDGRYIRMWIDEPRPKGVGFVNVKPGRYTVLIEFPDGRMGKQRIAVLPKETKTVTIQCPPPVEPSLVTIEGPKLEGFDSATDITAVMTISRGPLRLENTNWTVKDGTDWRVTLDLRTGRVTSLLSIGGERDKAIHFENSDPPDVRFLALTSGSYQLWNKGTITVRNQAWPSGFSRPGPEPVTVVAQPGTSTWTLTLPPEWLAKFHEELSKK